MEGMEGWINKVWKSKSWELPENSTEQKEKAGAREKEDSLRASRERRSVNAD